MALLYLTKDDKMITPRTLRTALTALLSNNGVSYKNMTTPTDMFIGFNPKEWSRHHDFKLTQALNALLNTDKVKVGHHRMDAHIVTSVSLTELGLSHVNRNDALRGV